ncbi:hypothetical protein M3J09_007017 [Ascochyta lentis]
MAEAGYGEALNCYRDSRGAQFAALPHLHGPYQAFVTSCRGTTFRFSNISSCTPAPQKPQTMEYVRIFEFEARFGRFWCTTWSDISQVQPMTRRGPQQHCTTHTV